MINNKISTLTLFLVSGSIFLMGQPSAFEFSPSILAAGFIGQIEVDNSPANEGDWLAAFDPDGNCAGANEIIIFEGKAYANLTIYGDDPATTQDEGLAPGETFTLQLFRSMEQDFLVYAEVNNPSLLDGWVNNNGAPLPGYNNPDAIFNFLTPLALSFEVMSDSPTCADSTNGFINLSINGGGAPYFFQWSDGSDENPRLNLSSGSYQCTVTDSFGQETITDTITLTAPIVLSVVSSIAKDTCGDGKGNINLLVDGGTVPYAINWENGAQGPVIEELSFGVYQATVIDDLGCTYLWEGEVFPTESFQSETTVNPVSCHAGGNGSIMAETFGGMGPFSFLWSTAETSAEISDLTAGEYGLTITDGYNCKLVDTIFVPQPMALEGEVVTMPSSNNEPNGSAFVTVTGGVEPYAYLWNDMNMQSDSFAQNLPPGDYTVLITDNNACVLILDTFIDNISGVVDNRTKEPGPVLFPNPLGEINYLTFQYPEVILSSKLRSFSGALVKDLNLVPLSNKRYQFEIGILPKGLYLLELESENRSYWVKIVY